MVLILKGRDARRPPCQQQQQRVWPHRRSGRSADRSNRIPWENIHAPPVFSSSSLPQMLCTLPSAYESRFQEEGGGIVGAGQTCFAAIPFGHSPFPLHPLGFSRLFVHGSRCDQIQTCRVTLTRPLTTRTRILRCTQLQDQGQRSPTDCTTTWLDTSDSFIRESKCPTYRIRRGRWNLPAFIDPQRDTAVDATYGTGLSGRNPAPNCL